ncbi:MAG: hypothetical protein J6T57_03120 [Alphaproteobacteria bacterium]|nr:hypothetical protein [Alphaproteobacteria bacterium]
MKTIDRSKSRKKKTTYVVEIDGMLVNYSSFEKCENTPLVVSEKNGEVQQQNDSGWKLTTMFKNPGANAMVTNSKLFKLIFGEKIARMIIEYNDKETGKPIITLFPDMIYTEYGGIAESLTHLNHETCRDCLRQIKLREDLYRQYEAKYR